MVFFFSPAASEGFWGFLLRPTLVSITPPPASPPPPLFRQASSAATCRCYPRTLITTPYPYLHAGYAWGCVIPKSVGSTRGIWSALCGPQSVKKCSLIVNIDRNQHLYSPSFAQHYFVCMNLSFFDGLVLRVDKMAELCSENSLR